MHGKKFCKVVFMLLFVLAVISSTAFIILEAGHDCDGENCPVCMCLNICNNNLKLITLIAINIILCELLLSSQVKKFYPVKIIYPHSDLISLKVKLSD